MRKFSKSIRFFIITGFLVAASMIVMAIRARIVAVKSIGPVEKAVVPKSYDPLLVNRFNFLANSMSLDKTCSYSGVLNVTDGTDTAKTAKNLVFICCKEGQNCYMKFGNTETINMRGIYVFIEHDQKKIAVGPQKEININTSPLAAPALFIKNLASENYALSSEKKDNQETIIFKNEKHMSCKEYSMTYDTATMKVARIFARLTNPADPLNSSKDKIIDMQFFSWTGKADFKKFPQVKDVIHKDGDEITLTETYKDYELIKL